MTQPVIDLTSGDTYTAVLGKVGYIVEYLLIIPEDYILLRVNSYNFVGQLLLIDKQDGFLF
ncbi:hypothetical protein SDC9_192215 [bioreactor metagenome]|uniref:Uncharacterized protein n=1 Tax=bioreactor metagenome TaxID=1076179 RepID=A0A645I0G3_9ZZZZ